jgi:hypothetical protein
MTKSQETRSAVDVAYQASRHQVNLLLGRVQDALGSHAAKQQKTPDYWTHVGDLDAVRENLQQILASLTGTQA